MSKLSQLQGKGTVFKIGGIDIELKPLRVDELEFLSIDEKAPLEDQMKASKRLINKVLKNSISDATDEEISNISLEHMQPIMEAIMKIHKFAEGDKRLSKIKDVIKSKQSQGKAPE
jgi:cell fate regulator YaaT (PSP1 superfamily)